MTLPKLKNTYLSLLLLGLSLTPSMAATFKIATVAPEGSGWIREMRAGAEAIKKQTDGRVEIKYFPGGVMGSDATVLRKIKLGQLQGGAFTAAELSSVYPDAQILCLPFTFNNEDEIDYVRTQLDPIIKQGLEQREFVGLGISGGGFAYLISAHPIQSKKDLMTAKVWTPQSDHVAIVTFEAGGVKPIPLPIADVYTALSTGLVDTVGNTPAGTLIFQWHTRLKHMVDLPLTYTVGYLVVDKKVFDKLDANDQAIMRQEMDGVFKRINQMNRTDNAAAKQALSKQGITIMAPEASEREIWNQVGETARNRLQQEGAFTAETWTKLVTARDAYRSKQVTSAQEKTE